MNIYRTNNTKKMKELSEAKELETQLEALINDEATPSNERRKRMVRLCYRLGRANVNLGKAKTALEYFDKAHDLQRELPEEDSVEVAENEMDLGYFYLKAGHSTRAGFCYRKAVKILEKHLGIHHLSTAYAYLGMGKVRQMDESYKEALEYEQKALSIAEETIGLESPFAADIFLALGETYEALSQECFQKSYFIRKRTLGPFHPQTQTVWKLIWQVDDEEENE